MEMTSLVKEVSDLAGDLVKRKLHLTDFEALQIAVKIQNNRIFKEAFGVDIHGDYPKFLEAIAMSQGYGSDNTNQVASALNNLDETLSSAVELIQNSQSIASIADSLFSLNETILNFEK